MNKVVVESYNPMWASWFLELKNSLWPSVSSLALAIEHVGSTSVPGLAAKPIIDIDIVIQDHTHLEPLIERLTKLGYEHRGNLGIEGREAFKAKHPIHRHNLYVCPTDSVSLKNHLCLRDSLRSEVKLRDAYAELKIELASRYPDSIDDYIEGKTDFILSVLRLHGHEHKDLEAIRAANRAPYKK